MPKSTKDSKNASVDPDDAPKLTDDFFERAQIREGDKVVRPAQGTLTRRGRPRSENPKRQITIRLDQDLLERLRASGSGWQSRVNEILRRSVLK